MQFEELGKAIGCFFVMLLVFALVVGVIIGHFIR